MNGSRLAAHCALTVALAVAAVVICAPAFADCAQDVQKMRRQQEAEYASVNNLVKAAHGKQIDPALFCARSAGLNRVEASMIAYMEKNKDWCSIPDDAIAQLKANHAKSLAFANKACTVAAQIRKLKAQQAQGGGGGGGGAPRPQPLPAGPL